MLISKLVKLRQQNLLILSNGNQNNVDKELENKSAGNSTGKSSGHHSAFLSAFSHQNLTHQILDSYQVKFTNNQKEWMKQLTHDSVQFLADKRGIKRRTVRESARLNKATTDLVSKIYTMLHAYALSYNGQIGWTELYVTCTGPSMVSEVINYNSMREPVETVTNLRASVSTGPYSLVIRARKDKVEILLVPSAKTIGLSKAEKYYSAVLTIDARLEGTRVLWTIAEKSFNCQVLEAYLMDLFGKLICASRNHELAG